MLGGVASIGSRVSGLGFGVEGLGLGLQRTKFEAWTFTICDLVGFCWI